MEENDRASEADVIVTGDCNRCGETIQVRDGVWPANHGRGKCDANPASEEE